LHFTSTIEKPEGIYHIRLYDSWLHSMEIQSRILFDSEGNSLGKEVSGDLIFEDGFGDVQSSFENELFQGAVEHQNWKLSLDADPVMAELVETWRNLDTDVWLEVVLEQRAIGIPEPKPFIMNQPLKQRLVWWGKLVRNEATGYVDYQSFKEQTGLVRNSKRTVHIGGLEMTFVHWLHALFAREASDFLDYYRDIHGLCPVDSTNIFATVFSLFYYLIRFIAPTKLVGFSDQSLHDWQDAEKDSNGMTKEFALDYTFKGDRFSLIYEAHSLSYLLIPRKDITGTRYSPLFTKASDTTDGNAGENSLYTRWQNLGDALVTLSREFFLKFDVELPTLRDAWEVSAPSFGYDNLKKDLKDHWKSASRWVFSSIDDFPLAIKTQPLSESIKYNPAALWIKKISIDVPTYSDMQDVKAEKILSTLEGKDISYKTLFSFINKNNRNQFDRRWIELTILPSTNLALRPEVVSVSFKIDGEDNSYSSWSQFHAYKNIDLWGGVRATVEFDHEGIGLEAFPDPIKGFGLLEWGDFGNLRYFDAAPGLLYSGSDYGRFSVIEISRKPGGNTHIRGIERKVLKSLPDIPLPPVPPPIDPPEINPPPVLQSFESICGVVYFVFGVEYDGECIDHVDFTIDGVYASSLGGWGNMPGKIVPCPIVVNTTMMTNGNHQICVTVYPCDGAPVTQCWMFTVSNPCTTFKPGIHL
jgi:hypothetical protein